MALAFLIYFPLYLLRGIGAGDVKLMTAVGAIAGPATWFSIFVFTLLFRGAIALILIVRMRRLQKTFGNIRLILVGIGSGKAPYRDDPQLDVRSGSGVRFPHAVVVALGTLTFLVASAVRSGGAVQSGYVPVAQPRPPSDIVPTTCTRFAG